MTDAERVVQELEEFFRWHKDETDEQHDNSCLATCRIAFLAGRASRDADVQAAERRVEELAKAAHEVVVSAERGDDRNCLFCGRYAEIHFPDCPLDRLRALTVRPASKRLAFCPACLGEGDEHIQPWCKPR